MSLPNRPTVKNAGMLIETPHRHQSEVRRTNLYAKPNIAATTR